MAINIRAGKTEKKWGDGRGKSRNGREKSRNGREKIRNGRGKSRDYDDFSIKGAPRMKIVLIICGSYIYYIRRLYLFIYIGPRGKQARRS